MKNLNEAELIGELADLSNGEVLENIIESINMIVKNYGLEEYEAELDFFRLETAFKIIVQRWDTLTEKEERLALILTKQGEDILEKIEEHLLTELLDKKRK